MQVFNIKVTLTNCSKAPSRIKYSVLTERQDKGFGNLGQSNCPKSDSLVKVVLTNNEPTCDFKHGHWISERISQSKDRLKSEKLLGRPIRICMKKLNLRVFLSTDSYSIFNSVDSMCLLIKLNLSGLCQMEDMLQLITRIFPILHSTSTYFKIFLPLLTYTRA